MGITYIRGMVQNPADRARSTEVEFLVDSGAIYSVVPATTLAQLGLEPDREEEFTLADGSHARRLMADAFFTVGSKRAASPVIFGESDDATLLGALTLESLGVMIDPFKRELRPLPMLLA